MLHKGGVAGQDDPQALNGRLIQVGSQGLLHVQVQGGKATLQQVLLGFEVVVKSAGGDPGLLADLPHRDLIEGALSGQINGGPQNGLFGLLCLLLAALGIVHKGVSFFS